MDKLRKRRMIRIIGMAVSGVAVCACAGGLFLWQGHGDDGPPQKDMALDETARQELLESVVSTLNHSYVHEDRAASMASALRANRAHGDYASITSAEQFAKTLTRTMQSMTNDKHLELRYVEAPIPVPAAGSEDNPEDEAALLAEGRRLNFGFETTGRLGCDIGYLDLHSFGRPDQVAGRIQAAMTLLADTRALIIDLRRNHGGDPESVMLMASYLFDQPTHLNDIYWREEKRTEQRWTQADVAGPRYGQARFVYLLTSEDTFSAGEDFAYALKYSGRATLVGEVTGGGAHPGNRRRLSEHFMMNVPTGRAINPITQTDWEQVGVMPDIKVTAKRALDTARIALLKKSLAAETDPVWQGRLRRCLSELN